MRGLIFDLVATLVSLGLALIGIGTARYVWVKKRANDPKILAEHNRRLGEGNAERAELEQEQRCGICQKSTIPDTDVFVRGQWFHRTCYESCNETE